MTVSAGRCASSAHRCDPVELHAHFDGGVWAAFGYTYYRGGRTTVSGVERDDEIGSSRAGLTLSLPIDRANSIKLAASRGISVRTGTDFDPVGVFWQRVWASAPN